MEKRLEDEIDEIIEKEIQNVRKMRKILKFETWSWNFQHGNSRLGNIRTPRVEGFKVFPTWKFQERYYFFL